MDREEEAAYLAMELSFLFVIHLGENFLYHSNGQALHKSRPTIAVSL